MLYLHFKNQDKVNKNSALNIVLVVAVVVLYIMHFKGGESANDSEVKLENQESSVADVATETANDVSDTASSDLVVASSSKVAYFDLQILVEKCSYLKLKTEQLIKKEERLYNSAAQKEQEFKQWYEKKQVELAEYDQKKMLVQSHLDQAQRQSAEKQQALQIEMQKEEKSLVEEKQRFLLERDDIISKAIEQLNKKAGWDYVLVDNPEIRIVVPFNKKNDITGNLADIINKKHKK